MINIISIENALYDWIFTVTNTETILADPNAPRPLGAYLTFKIINANSIGTHGENSTLLVNKSIDIEASKIYDISVSINAFRANSFENLSKLVDSISKISIIEDLTSNGLYYISESDIRHISVDVKKEIEERHQVDFNFYIRSSSADNIESIQKIEITNEISGDTTIIENP